MTVFEPARETHVIAECDLCVVGGSCTGLFAAIRAARLGLSVVLIESMGCLGGVATQSLVNIWHSQFDEIFEKQIFAGLTLEVIGRLRIRNAVIDRARTAACAWVFNSAEMQIELDAMAAEAGIQTWLHTAFVAPHIADGKLDAVIVENKSGRGAIRARFFIDATGDGDLCDRLSIPTYHSPHTQPPTTCAHLSGWETLKGSEWEKIVIEHAAGAALPEGFAWGCPVPGTDAYMLAGTRVLDADCSDARNLARAEMEGRRQVRAIMDILNQHVPGARLGLLALPARIGIRQTRHVRCLRQLTGEEVLHGCRFDDAIANGSYRVDIHHDDKPGITFRYLDGREDYLRPGHPAVFGRWRDDSGTSPTYYQIPYRCLVPQGPYGNLLAAGRFIDADEQAHAAIRVMVNMNQTGEAAGVAAFLALDQQTSAGALDPDLLRRTLAEGGSIVF